MLCLCKLTKMKTRRMMTKAMRQIVVSVIPLLLPPTLVCVSVGGGAGAAVVVVDEEGRGTRPCGVIFQVGILPFGGPGRESEREE